MAHNDRLRKVLSLSAASLALMQSVVISKGQSSANPSAQPNPNSANGEIMLHADSLLLKPPHHSDLPLLYAHASHASHSSHSSHTSGTSDYGGYDYSTTSATTTPVSPAPQPQVPVPVQAQPITNSAAATMDANSSVTNAVTTTSSTDTATAEAHAAYIDELTNEAAKGSPGAQLALGLAYRDGNEGLKKSTERAKMLFELAARQGNANAKTFLDNLNASDTETNNTTAVTGQP